MHDSHCPTKTLSVHGGIRPDQIDVPALVNTTKPYLESSVCIDCHRCCHPEQPCSSLKPVFARVINADPMYMHSCRNLFT